MLAIQYLLRSGATLEHLAARYAISHKRHNKHPNLVLLKYSQIDSPFAERVVQECRGIILDEADDWRVVARAFDKFFNHGEGHAAQIDWSTARVQEKLDGSLCMLYHYAGEWHVSTTGTPDASGNVNGLDMTFADLFWSAWAQHQYEPPPEGYCLMFELTSPHNRVVVPHTSTRLTLIGSRCLWGGSEEEPAYNWSDKYRVVREHPLTNLDQIISTFDTLDPLRNEGYVVVDGDFNRIKVKHPGYVALHHLKDGLSSKRLLEIVRAGESSEFLTYFPEFAEEYNRIRESFERLVGELEHAYESARFAATQKDFAMTIKDLPCSAALFQLRAGKVRSVREFLSKYRLESLLDTLNLKEQH